MNQSELEANTCKSWRQARENACEQVAIGLSFTSDWLRKWRVIFYHHFHYYATFLFKTPLNTLQYASVNHTLYGKCLMLPQLN